MNNYRLFFARHPTTKEPISMREGQSGYSPVVVGGDNSTAATDEKLAATNALFNNTDKDIEIAIACSMYGWDIPMADDLS